MARRKSALIFLLMLLLLIILSPWASAPSSPAAPAPAAPKDGPSAATAPAAEETSVPLRIAVALGEAEFRLLLQQNEQQADRFRDLAVEIVRVDPDKAYEEFLAASRIGEAADVMLVESEWVQTFATSGFLLPADSAFVGDALAEQFDALSAPLKWNGYLWGVPRDFDPYVLVWNLPVMYGLIGETTDTPASVAQWAALAGKSLESGTAVSWLAIDGSDPYALLAWLQSATGQRTDTLWSQAGTLWTGNTEAEAMALLANARQSVAFGIDSADAAGKLVSGLAAVAVLPYSVAEKITLPGIETGAHDLIMDRSAWNLPYHWPRGRSFVVSARTEAEDAARRWIAIMTEAALQEENESSSGKLPVYRSLYRAGSPLASLISVGNADVFPNQPPADYGPELPVRMTNLRQLWTEWAAGRMTNEDWALRWAVTSTDLQPND